MYKLLAVSAALLGSVSAWSYQVLPSTSFKSADGSFTFLTCQASTTFKAGYASQYNPSGQTPYAPSNSQVYDINLYAGINFVFEYEIFQTYKAKYTFNLAGLDFTPYGQVIEWNRFDAGHGFGFFARGYRYINLLKFTTKVVENVKTASWQYDQGTLPYQPTWDYNDNLLTEYTDPYWKFSLADWVDPNAILGFNTYY